MLPLAFRFGLLGSILVIGYFLALYVIDPTYFIHPAFQWGGLLFYIACMWAATRRESAQFEQARVFREMLRTPFLVFILINLAYWLFYYGLHLFDKNLIVLELDANIRMLQSELSAGTGDPSTAHDLRLQIDQMEMLRRQPMQPLGPVLLQMAQGAIGGFALAAIIVSLNRR